VVGAALGRWAFAATLIGLTLAWAYSAPPLRLKLNGWWGNAACAACYEGLPWLTGAAIMAGTLPAGRVFAVAALYSAGAHGIMTLNDFKSVPGDAVMGIRSLPVQLGIEHAARTACLMMALPQLAVIALLISLHLLVASGLVCVLLAAQIGLMLRFMERPRELAPWYNGTGTSLYVLGMLVCAFALRPL
jgi:chlorophyll synthase